MLLLLLTLVEFMELLTSAMGAMNNSSLAERREDLRGGFMLCFLDDGTGMDSSK